MFVILLAGLTSIPPNLYEAAELDGVGAWQAFWCDHRCRTSRPMMLLALTFRLLDAIRLFDTIFIMTGGGPGTQTYTASFYLYTVGFTQFHLSPGDRRELAVPDLHRARRHPAGAPAAARGAGLMAAPSPRPAAAGAASLPIGRILLLGFFVALRAAAALLDVQHLDQAERRLPGDPAGLVPGRADAGALHGGALHLPRASRG